MALKADSTILQRLIRSMSRFGPHILRLELKGGPIEPADSSNRAGNPVLIAHLRGAQTPTTRSEEDLDQFDIDIVSRNPLVH
jgi:hypothetical protein